MTIQNGMASNRSTKLVAPYCGCGVVDMAGFIAYCLPGTTGVAGGGGIEGTGVEGGDSNCSSSAGPIQRAHVRLASGVARLTANDATALRQQGAVQNCRREISELSQQGRNEYAGLRRVE